MCNAPMPSVASTSACNLGDILAEKYGPIAEPQPREPYQFSVRLGAFRFDGPESLNADKALRGFVDGAVNEAIARAGGLALSLGVMAANSASHDLELLREAAGTASERGVTILVETEPTDPDLPGNTRRADDPELQSVLETGEEFVSGVTLTASGVDGDAELVVHTGIDGTAWAYNAWFLAADGREVSVKADTLEGLKARLFQAAKSLQVA